MWTLKLKVKLLYVYGLTVKYLTNRRVQAHGSNAMF